MMRQSAADELPAWHVLLRELRRAAGITQEGWAARLGYGRRTIQRWERGEIAPDATAAEILLSLCRELALFRTYRLGSLAGLEITPEQLSRALADARVGGGPRLVSHSPGAGDGSRRCQMARLNLPADYTSFVGREDALSAARDLLGGTRLLTLVGIGGVGKTRLAIQLASQVAGDFDDGVRFVDLSTLNAGAPIAQAVATASDVRGQPARPMVDSLRDGLRARHMLLLLDNCEHLIDSVAELAVILLQSCASIKLLVTSREPVKTPGETIFRVNPLGLPSVAAYPGGAQPASEAARLFLDRAYAASPGLSLTSPVAAIVDDICRRLDGIPLALELAAAQLRSQSITEIAAQLDDRFRMLGGARGVAARHRSLQAAIDGSYQSLADTDRRLFECLAVFAGGFSVEAAAAVYGAPSGPVASSLSRLVEKSLVTRTTSVESGTGRYRLLETLRAFALERLDARGAADEARRRHAVWVLREARQLDTAIHGPEQARWFRRAADDYDNVRSALAYLLDTGDAESAQEIAGAFWWCWGALGWPAEARTWLERAVALGAPNEPTAPRAAALLGLAFVLMLQADVPAAAGYLKDAESISRRLADERLAILLGMGRLQIQLLGHTLEPAELSVTDLMEAAERLGDHWLTCRLLEMGAHRELRGGRSETAIVLLRRSVAIARQAQDQWSLATSLGELGDLARAGGDYELAGERYAESLALREALNIPGTTPSLRHNLAYVSLATGNVGRAQEHFLAAYHEFRRIGERRGMAECLIGLSGVEVTLGHAALGAELLGTGEGMLDALGSRVWPSNERDYRSIVQTLTEQLGARSFEERRRAGRSRSLDEALALLGND